MKTINTKYILSLKPCEDRRDNYLKYYKDFSGTIIDFLELVKITSHDKVWVLTRNYDLLSEAQLREFALICASRAVDGADISEVTTYYILNLLMPESGDDLTLCDEYRDAYWSTNSAAYRAAESAADLAAHSAAYRVASWVASSESEREVQVEILKGIVLNEVESE